MDLINNSKFLKTNTILHLIFLDTVRRIRTSKEQENVNSTPLTYMTTQFDGDMRSQKMCTGYNNSISTQAK